MYNAFKNEKVGALLLFSPLRSRLGSSPEPLRKLLLYDGWRVEEKITSENEFLAALQSWPTLPPSLLFVLGWWVQNILGVVWKTWVYLDLINFIKNDCPLFIKIFSKIKRMKCVFFLQNDSYVEQILYNQYHFWNEFSCIKKMHIKVDKLCF